ncbi:TIGR04338 family metallohydrolase [Gordonia sp. DT218]|uniref:TIGR04338 family metallohydrolase n=1 Tax=unclassified Gordonia (in: high G+C Gram-positive bacteria) TaxID=2657482 RepID=UPI003CEB29FA
MTPRDTGRAQMYAAERIVHRMFDHAGSAANGRMVELAGARVTLPSEASFASVESVADYVTRVLTLPAVSEEFARAALPVRVRRRRGHRSAEYRRTPDGAEIAVPTSAEGRWALRELVVLHEIAHHLDDSTDASHGRGFVITLIELVGRVMGPEAAFVYRVVFADSGVGA